MKRAIREGDVVVVDTAYAQADLFYEYDFSAWASTRMTVLSIETGSAVTEAIDPRPDREWILRNRRDGDTRNPQDSHMFWPLEHLRLAS